MPSFQLTILLLSTSLTICVARATPGKWNSCDGRLERTLEALSKDTTKKSRLVEGDGAVAYQQDLRSVPVEMTVSRFAVKLTMPPLFDDYEAAEPRELLSVAKEVDVAIVNESRQSLDSSDSAGIWRKNVWVTKSPIRRSAIDNLEKDQPTSVKANIFSRDGKEAFPLKNRFKRQEVRESVEIITPEDFATALVNKKLFKSARSFGNCSSRANEIPMASNTTSRAPGGRDADDCTEARSNLKMEDAFETNQEVSRETRELMQIEDPEGVEIDGKGRSWQNEEYIAREMEDIFLRGASQALTNYIERQLHPAIKETLMLSMGYTISYG